jgi:hypothetical protein
MQLEPTDSDKEKNERLKSQVKALRSGNRTSILDAIKEIRKGSSVSILPELFDVLVVQEDEMIIDAGSSLLNDLKTEDAIPVLVDAIKNPEYQPITSLLVAACWQNGLSYGKYAETFVKVAIESNYEAAIEAITVLEEAIGDMEEEERRRLSNMVKRGILDSDEQKKLLLHELIKIIETY